MPKFYEFLCFIIDFFYRRLLNSRCMLIQLRSQTTLLDHICLLQPLDRQI